MKLKILFLILFTTGCATADIAVDKAAMKSVKTIAIAPFTTSVDLPRNILSEAEGNFWSALIKLQYKVVEREKLNTILKEKELAMTGITAENAKSVGVMLGADAILLGEVLSYNESQREVEDFETKVKEIKTFYKFQIIVRLVDVSTGSIILTVKNASPEVMQVKELSGYSSLDSYRILVLNQMETDLVNAIKK